MKTRAKTGILVFLLLLAIIPLQLPIRPAKAAGIGASPSFHYGEPTISWDSSLYADWKYRREVTVTEPNVADRVNEPIDLYLTFPPSTARSNSIRILYFNGTDWHNVTTQVWNEAWSGQFYDSCTVTFLANLTKGSSTTYYVYYTDQSVSGLNYHPFVSKYNDTADEWVITGANYSARMALDHGYLVDFVIDNNDVIGEFRYSTETGIIADCNNPWRDEVGSSEDTAEIDPPIIIGPAFIRIVLNKTTDYGLGIDRVWTFYPNYFTLESTMTPNPYRSQRYLVYGRSFHNGTTVNGALITAKMTVGGEISNPTATINGYGGYENINTYGVTQPWWFAVNGDGFAYSCIPVPDSYEFINHLHYYDRADSNPAHYGAAGWSYYDSEYVSSVPHTATLVYVPHPEQPDTSFGQTDYERRINLALVNIGSEEYRGDNQLNINVEDQDGAPVSNATVEVSTIGSQETDTNGLVAFEGVLSGSYTVAVNYSVVNPPWNNVTTRTVNSTSTQIPAINPNRVKNDTITVTLSTLHVKVIDDISGEPLFNYTVIANSTANLVNTTGQTDSSGWHNFTLFTSPDSFYGLNASDPDGVKLDDNVTVDVDINSTGIVIMNVSEAKAITRLSLAEITIKEDGETKSGGRSEDLSEFYVEVFWKDSVTLELPFIYVANDSAIPDATIKQWILTLGPVNYQGNATFNSTTKRYEFEIATDDYAGNWDVVYTLAIHFERIGCTIPANVIITLKVKPWNTTLSSTPETNVQNYWRENVTISLNFTDILNETDHIIMSAAFDYLIDGVEIGSDATFGLNLNGTVVLEINTTSLALGPHTLTIAANHTYHQQQNKTLILMVTAVPTSGIWTDLSSQFAVNVTTLRAAIGETVNVTVNANSSSPSFQNQLLSGGTGDCTWEAGSIALTEDSPGAYSFILVFSNITAGDYTLIVAILKTNYTPVNIYISLNLLDEWTTSLTILDIDPDTVPWGKNATITLSYSCSLFPRAGQMLENATIYFTWPNYMLNELGNGIYEIILNTSIRSPDDTYVPLAYAYRQFYENGTTVQPISFYTSKLKTSASLLEWSASISQGEDNLLRVRLTDTDNNVSILDATITYSIEGSGISGALIPVGDTYEASMPTQELAPGEYWIVLHGSLPGRTVGSNTFDVYEAPSGDIRFSLTIVAPFPILLLAAAFGGAVSSVPIGIWAWRYYKWIKLPPTVKKIVKTVRTIKKGGMTEIGIAPAREVLINERMVNYFESAGISLPEVELVLDQEVVPEVEELRKLVGTKFPDVSQAERESLVKELLGMDPKERDEVITTLHKARIKERSLIEEGVSEEIFKVEEYEKALDELVEKQIITGEEKKVIIEEIRDLPPKERKKFLEKLEKP